MTKKCKQKIIISILFIIWLVILFIFSNSVGEESSKLSSNISKNIYYIFSNIFKNNFISFNFFHAIIRKTAHYVLYIIGGIIITSNFFLYIEKKEDNLILISLFIGSLISILDEMHQALVPGRTPMITDIFIDTLGVATGILIVIIFKHIIIKKSKIGGSNNEL